MHKKITNRCYDELVITTHDLGRPPSKSHRKLIRKAKRIANRKVKAEALQEKF